MEYAQIVNILQIQWNYYGILTSLNVIKQNLNQEINRNHFAGIRKDPIPWVGEWISTMLTVGRCFC